MSRRQLCAAAIIADFIAPCSYKCSHCPDGWLLPSRPDLEDYALVGNVLRDWVTA